MRRYWGLLVAAVVCVSLFYLLVTRQSPPEPGTGLSADRLCRKLLQEKPHVEALGWARQSKRNDIRTVGEQSPARSLKIIMRLYDAGAAQVQAVGLERVSGVGETTNTLCVELPHDAEKRKNLLKIEANVAAEGGFDGVFDDGQDYLFLHGFKMWFLP